MTLRQWYALLPAVATAFCLGWVMTGHPPAWVLLVPGLLRDLVKVLEAKE